LLCWFQILVFMGRHTVTTDALVLVLFSCAASIIDRLVEEGQGKYCVITIEHNQKLIRRSRLGHPDLGP